MKRDLPSSITIDTYFGRTQSVRLSREKLTANYYIAFWDGVKTHTYKFSTINPAMDKFKEIKLNIEAK
jgi:hypothetical protein